MNGVKTLFQAVPTFIPKMVPVGLLLLGLILGFVWAYKLSPTVYTAAEPVNLGDTWKQEYIKQVAWQFAASGDSDNAKRQLASLGNAKEELDKLMAANADPANLTPKLQALQPFVADNPAQLSKVTPGFLNSDLTPILCVVVLAILAGGFVIFNTLIPISLLLSRQSTAPSSVVSGQFAQTRAINAAVTKTDYNKVNPDRGTPVAQFMSTYLLNDDVYDDSFAIETSTDEFLGETGAGISKTLGDDKPKKVTAVEAWVFDKNDIRTVTKVLMSEYAFNDPALRAELASKGDAVLAVPNGIVMLETQTLTVQVRVVNLSYGTGNTPPNSFFDQLTLEIASWPKVAPAATAGVMPTTAAAAPLSSPPPPTAADPYTGDTGKFPA